MEPTEREKKLVNYIIWLIQMLNNYTVFIAYLYKNLDGLEEMIKPLQEKDTEDELVNFLNTEFDANLRVQLDRDYIKKSAE